MIAKKCGKDWYICRDKLLGRNWFLINYRKNLQINTINFPKEFIGKKIRLKIEEVKDAD